MSVSILNPYREMHTSAIICVVEIIAHQFVKYCHEKRIASSCYEVDRMLRSELQPALEVAGSDSTKLFITIMNQLYFEKLQQGLLSLEIRINLEAIDDIAINYFNWYMNEAIKAACVSQY